MTRRQPPVQAAGALCWTRKGGKVRVLLLGRTRHGDVSLPKGKADPGELLPHTAVREVEEETGLRVRLGAPLGEVGYPLPGGREKTVHYWAARVPPKHASLTSFVPNDEISSASWASLGEARRTLTYPHDVDILNEFAARFERGRAHTFALVLLRHGKAVAHSDWDGPDALRPLQERGRLQSELAAPAIAAFRPKRLVTSDAVRCADTMEPLAALLGKPVRRTPLISQDAYESGEDGVRKVVRTRLKKRVDAVLCSHGPVLPEIVQRLLAETGGAPSSELRRAASLDTGGFSVLHLTVGGKTPALVAVETYGPAA